MNYMNAKMYHLLFFQQFIINQVIVYFKNINYEF